MALFSFEELSRYEQERTPQELIEEDVLVNSDALAAELTCVICMEILKKTMTSKRCMHRFCYDCITTSLRLGNKECPTCRTKLTSKRDLQADHTFDSLIKALFPHSTKEQSNEDITLAPQKSDHSDQMCCPEQSSLKKKMQTKQQLHAKEESKTMGTPSKKRGRKSTKRDQQEKNKKEKDSKPTKAEVCKEKEEEHLINAEKRQGKKLNSKQDKNIIKTNISTPVITGRCTRSKSVTNKNNRGINSNNEDNSFLLANKEVKEQTSMRTRSSLLRENNVNKIKKCIGEEKKNKKVLKKIELAQNKKSNKRHSL